VVAVRRRAHVSPLLNRAVLALGLGSIVVLAVFAQTAFAATPPMPTGLRAVPKGALISAPGGRVTVSGRVVSIKRVRRRGRWTTVEAPLSTGVYLMYEDAPHETRAKWVRASRGRFTFTVSLEGNYQVLVPSTKRHRGSRADVRVRANCMSIRSFGVVAASRDSSGNVDVTVSGDFEAVGRVFLRRFIPGVLHVGAWYGADDTDRVENMWRVDGSALTQIAPFDEQLLWSSATHTYRFEIPAGRAKETCTIGAYFSTWYDDLEVPVSAEVTLCPNSEATP
jgi:hypothetical protein